MCPEAEAQTAQSHHKWPMRPQGLSQQLLCPRHVGAGHCPAGYVSPVPLSLPSEGEGELRSLF